MKEAIQGLNTTSVDFSNYIAAQKEDFFQKEFTVKTITSGVYTQKAFEMVHHCMNHSTYHRGQLLMMARQLGLKNLPSTDMIYYLRENQ